MGKKAVSPRAHALWETPPPSWPQDKKLCHHRGQEWHHLCCLVAKGEVDQVGEEEQANAEEEDEEENIKEEKKDTEWRGGERAGLGRQKKSQARGRQGEEEREQGDNEEGQESVGLWKQV